jgi:F-type H+-transporting ATPase subunit b
VLTAVVTKGAQIQVRFARATGEESHAEEEAEHFDPADCEFEPDEAGATECDEGPNPIMPELKELAWGAGSFIVFALLMRFFLFPRLKRSMDARYNHIRSSHEGADAVRAAARSEVATYEAALAEVRAEANQRIEAARRTLEAERQASLAEVNARITAKRDEAAEAARAVREAARGDVITAAADVASRTTELAIGRAPDPATVRRAVEDAIGAGVAS